MARAQEIEIVAEMVANVMTVYVATGDTVALGDTVVLLESMKMEIPVVAEHGGTVTGIWVGPGRRRPGGRRAAGARRLTRRERGPYTARCRRAQPRGSEGCRSGRSEPP